MKLGRITSGLLALGVLMGAAAPISAEEITLKDGQKIVGTIVGYEKDMFRVETAYGIALVRKDKVASIQVTRTDPTSPPTPQRPDPKPLIVAPAHTEAAPEPPPAPPASHPVDVPIPAHLQEHVDGNTYYSDTFQFSMFKPPDWQIYEGVPKETGSGIMAMGTEDEQTLLIVDRQVWSGTPRLTSDQVEAKLRQTYQEYHRISEEDIVCDGETATRRTFTGVLEGTEWHGVAVHVIHGNVVFGIIGLTSAETFQFQEAIFNKVIKTLHFQTPPTGPATPLHP
jgi:hypothetical protein